MHSNTINNKGRNDCEDDRRNRTSLRSTIRKDGDLSYLYEKSDEVEDVFFERAMSQKLYFLHQLRITVEIHCTIDLVSMIQMLVTIPTVIIPATRGRVDFSF